MEGKWGSSHMVLLQKYFNFSNRVCRHIFLKKVWSQGVIWSETVWFHTVRAKTKEGNGADVFRLHPTMTAHVAPSLHQQPLPRAPWGRGVLPAARFLPVAGELGIIFMASRLCALHLLRPQNWCSTLHNARLATCVLQLCLGWGWNILSSPLT